VSRPDYYGNPAGLTADVEVVRAIYAAFQRRDVEAAIAHMAEDCELHLMGTAREVGREEPYRGHAGLREYLADVERVWDRIDLGADDFRAVPGSVIVVGHVDAERRGERVRRSVVWTWQVRDGKATYARVSDMGELE
jgi:ketosteroid isomerase-like protein